MKQLLRRVLGVPLVAKLIGANVIVVVSAIALRQSEMTTAAIALAAASIVNILLVRIALRPVQELESVAARVSAGEFDARSTSVPYADKDLARLSGTVNGLLDALAAERRRIHDLGEQVVRAHDVERANVSRELHDSIAQTLAAVRFQLSAAGREDELLSMRQRLATANTILSSAMDEIMNVSYSLHSRVAEELGLEAALGMLARQVESRSGASVDVMYASSLQTLPPVLSATLFRVAQEALREFEVQRREKSATVSVEIADGMARLEVSYESDPLRLPTASVRLASLKDRVLLAGGTMVIENRNGGTRVTAELETMRAAS